MEEVLIRQKTPCKVYCDSSHYVAVPMIQKSNAWKRTGNFEDRDEQFRKAFDAVLKAGTDRNRFLMAVRDFMFENFNVTYQFQPSWNVEKKQAIEHFFETGELPYSVILRPGEKNVMTSRQKDAFLSFDEHFEEAFRASAQEGLRGEKQKSWIRGYLDERGDILQNDEAFLDAKFRTHLHNLYNRRKRFRRKGYLNPWHYFVTITYDSKKMDEDEFRASLKRTFNNFHTRRGWKYMGCFERGEANERLHFHALVYIPAGQTPGRMKKVKRFSEREKKMKIMDENSFFRDTYGINTFDPIQQETFAQGKVINYILKYLLKDGEKVVYGRGIPTELEKMIEDQDVATEMVDFVAKFVLFDDADILCSEPDDLPDVKEQEPEGHLRI